MKGTKSTYLFLLLRIPNTVPFLVIISWLTKLITASNDVYLHKKYVTTS